MNDVRTDYRRPIDHDAVERTESSAASAVDTSGAPRASAPPRAEPALDYPIAYPPELFGGGSALVQGSPEANVASRPDRDRPLAFEGARESDRRRELSRLTQIDGDARTITDGSTCGPTCVIAAMYVQNPQGLRTLAQHELEGDCARFAKALGVKPDELKRDLQAIATGAPTPRHLAVLAQVLLEDLRERNPAMRDYTGTKAKDLQVLTKEIIMKECHLDPPRLRLELTLRKFGDKWSGHWTARIDDETTRGRDGKTDDTRVTTFDPWPNKGGRAPVNDVASHYDAAQQQRDTNQDELVVKSDGSVVPLGQ